MLAEMKIVALDWYCLVAVNVYAALAPTAMTNSSAIVIHRRRSTWMICLKSTGDWPSSEWDSGRPDQRHNRLRRHV